MKKYLGAPVQLTRSAYVFALRELQRFLTYLLLQLSNVSQTDVSSHYNKQSVDRVYIRDSLCSVRIAMKDEWQLLMIIKGVCKCDIDLLQQLIKQEVNIKWFIMSDYNTMALFCSISSTKIVSDKVKAEPLRISIQTQRCFIYEWTAFLKNLVSQWFTYPFIKTVTYFVPEWISCSKESIEWMIPWSNQWLTATYWQF